MYGTMNNYALIAYWNDWKRLNIMSLTKSDRAYFNAAKAVSKLSDFPKVNIGSVVVYKHRIISSGCNMLKEAPIQKKFNKYRFTEDNGQTRHCTHAEVNALKPLIGRDDIEFKNVEIYTYREYKNGELALARCCPSCEKLIRSLGIRFVHYTGTNSYIDEELIY